MKARRLATRKRAASACKPCKSKKSKCSDYRPCAQCKTAPNVTCVEVAISTIMPGRHPNKKDEYAEHHFNYLRTSSEKKQQIFNNEVGPTESRCLSQLSVDVPTQASIQANQENFQQEVSMVATTFPPSCPKDGAIESTFPWMTCPRLNAAASETRQHRWDLAAVVDDGFDESERAAEWKVSSSNTKAQVICRARSLP